MDACALRNDWRSHRPRHTCRVSLLGLRQRSRRPRQSRADHLAGARAPVFSRATSGSRPGTLRPEPVVSGRHPGPGDLGAAQAGARVPLGDAVSLADCEQFATDGSLRRRRTGWSLRMDSRMVVDDPDRARGSGVRTTDASLGRCRNRLPGRPCASVDSRPDDALSRVRGATGHTQQPVPRRAPWLDAVVLRLVVHPAT